MKFLKFMALCLMAGCFLTCLNACSAKKVTRVESTEVIDLSGNWNDTDSQLVSQAMIKDSLNNPWYAEFKGSNSRKPIVIVGQVLNKTEEHLNTETFVKDLERELINTGKVTFVASSSQREELRQERKEQAVNSRNPKQNYQETAADFMLKGQINTIVDTNGKDSVKYYQIELEMIDMETNEKVWIGQHKIKKVISKKKYKI